MIWPLGVLNRGTERRGSDEERTPSSSNRARRRTKLEVHGDARTRPKSARLRKRKETPSRIVPGPLLSPFKAPSGVRARDGRELSDTERAAFAKCMHFATRCGQASVADVCKEWGISKSHGYKILNRWRTEESVQSRPRSGRPCALTEEDMHTLECLSEELKGYFTWESLAKRFTEKTGKRVSCTTVYSSCKSAGWRQVCERYVPCLSASMVARRLEWAKQHVDYTWTGTKNLRYPNVLNRKVGWVDIDEKWWDMLRKRAVKVHPGQHRRTRVPTKSKRFVQKVMGLCAVARPCGDFDGRIGISASLGRYQSSFKSTNARSNTALPIKTSFGTSSWSNTISTMTARDSRDAGMSKLQSPNASSTPTERTITSYRTVSSTRNPFLSIFS